MFGTGTLTSPAAVAVQVETPIRPKAHQKQGNFPDIRGAVQRFRAATVEWTTEWSDEWAKRYGNKNKVVASTENDPLIDRLRKETGEDFDDISPFFDWYPSSRLLDRQARRVKGFCEGSAPLIDKPSTNGPENEPSNTDQETSAWVSDRNWPRDAIHKTYGRILNGQQLDEVLQKKRFSENGGDEEAGPPRRIYINKPNRNNINAILRTTPPSQVPGFQELMANYITGDPSPVLRSREIFWWGAMCFLFSFNLPFFATTFESRQDNRTLFNGKRPLRRRHDLSFLKMGVSDQDYYEGDDEPREPLYLLGGVCSIVVTGRSERYWTAACLNDDLSPDEDEPRLSMESEKHRMGPETDPIILKTENEAVSPRAYALAALATALTKIVDYHRDIQIEFGISLSHHTCKSWHGRPENIPFEQMQEWRIRYLEVLNWVIDGNARIVEKLERFLSRDLLVTPEGLPQHPLWQSVFKEERVTQSLTEIRDSLDHLSDVDSELRRLLKTCIEERREMKNKYQDEQSKFQDEQSRRDKRIQKITFAGFVLAILNLVAQIYAGRPENISVLSSPGFMTLTWVSLVICFIICLAPFWDNVLWFLKNLSQYLRGFAMAIKDFTTQQLGCLKAFMTFGKHFMLGVARWVLKLRRVDVVLRKTRVRAFWRRERGILPA